ncbi:MAG: hypothetical protein V2J19_05935 [Wenzhouxiangella sp.]|jgi:hypothetical protein|nr:hypothetical protein [Wenzhouxiangella sp.]
MKFRTVPALLAATLLAACGQESARNAESVEGLELTFAPIEYEGAECRIQQTARVDQDRHGLYTVRGEGVYRSSESDRIARIPLQIRFRGLEGIQTEQVITLTDMQVPCETVGIAVDIGGCTNQDRKKAPCPHIVGRGGSSFAELTIKQSEG